MLIIILSLFQDPLYDTVWIYGDIDSWPWVYMAFAMRTANNNQYPICNHTSICRFKLSYLRCLDDDCLTIRGQCTDTCLPCNLTTLSVVDVVATASQPRKPWSASLISVNRSDLSNFYHNWLVMLRHLVLASARTLTILAAWCSLREFV